MTQSWLLAINKHKPLLAEVLTETSVLCYIFILHSVCNIHKRNTYINAQI